MAKENISADYNDDQATTVPQQTDINFLALCGTPIEGLCVRVNLDGNINEYQTDSQGRIPPIVAAPDLPVSIAVQRFDGSFKTINEFTSSHSDSSKTLISPALLLEATTEEHEGAAGAIEQTIPAFKEADKGLVLAAVEEPPVSDVYRNEGHNHPEPKAAPKPASKAPPKPSTPHTAQLPDPKLAKGPVTGPKAPLQSGRDANGNPLVVYAQKVVDWWGRWHFPWIRADAAIAPVSAMKVAYSGGMEDKVKALIEVATALTDHEIPGTTASYLTAAKTGKKTLDDYAKKPGKDSKGWCYKYVKIALVQAHVADDAPAGESASAAGPELEKLGFKEVTQSLPDARWAAAGDVIVYRWSDATWEKRRDQKNQPNMPNHGHIDIRSYESYISDFVPRLKRPGWHDYTDIRIYRKVFDVLPTLHIKAFLRCLQWCEVFGAEPSKYYQTNRGFNPFTYFDSFKVHPAHSMPAGTARDNTPAGAYQIIYGNWRKFMALNVLQLPAGADLFSPMVQDRLAVFLIEGNDALHLVRTAQLEAAIQALRPTWPSLPGANQNVVGRTMEAFKSNFAQFLAEEKTKAGLV